MRKKAGPSFPIPLVPPPVHQPMFLAAQQLSALPSLAACPWSWMVFHQIAVEVQQQALVQVHQIAVEVQQQAFQDAVGFRQQASERQFFR